MSAGFAATPEQIEAVRERFRSEGTCAEMVGSNICILPAGHEPGHEPAADHRDREPRDDVETAIGRMWNLVRVQSDYIVHRDALQLILAELEQLRKAVGGAIKVVSHHELALHDLGAESARLREENERLRGLLIAKLDETNAGAAETRAALASNTEPATDQPPVDERERNDEGTIPAKEAVPDLAARLTDPSGSRPSHRASNTEPATDRCDYQPYGPDTGCTLPYGHSGMHSTITPPTTDSEPPGYPPDRSPVG